MSIVAVKVEQDHITIGADSGDIWGDTKLSISGNKLWMITKHLVAGSVGSAAVGLWFKKYLQDFCPTLTENSEHGWAKFAHAMKINAEHYGLRLDDNSFLVVYRGRVWRINGLHVSEVTTFEAIGAGRTYALAALQLGHNVEQAVGVACTLCIHCVSPMVLLSVSREK